MRFVWVLILNFMGRLRFLYWFFLFGDNFGSWYMTFLPIKLDNLRKIQVDCFFIVFKIAHWIRPVVVLRSLEN